MKFDEGNLRLDFSDCIIAERFDDKSINSFGMKAVDFVAETHDCVYFVEVKDYQNPKATKERKKADLTMLSKAIEPKNKTVFCLEMGEKIKDSLLRQYALNKPPTKRVVYLLFINLEKFGEFERGLLKEKISGYIPTGLNDKRFIAFTNISFELVNAEQLASHGIICTSI